MQKKILQLQQELQIGRGNHNEKKIDKDGPINDNTSTNTIKDNNNTDDSSSSTVLQLVGAPAPKLEFFFKWTTEIFSRHTK